MKLGTKIRKEIDDLMNSRRPDSLMGLNDPERTLMHLTLNVLAEKADNGAQAESELAKSFLKMLLRLADKYIPEPKPQGEQPARMTEGGTK